MPSEVQDFSSSADKGAHIKSTGIYNNLAKAQPISSAPHIFKGHWWFYKWR